MLSPPKPGVKPIAPTEVTPAIRRGGPTERERQGARDVRGRRSVRLKDIHPVTHTRLPQYVRGHLGTIELNHGCHVFPDTNSHRKPARIRNGSTPSFRRAGIVGQGCRPDAQLSIDAWESYLERV